MLLLFGKFRPSHLYPNSIVDRSLPLEVLFLPTLFASVLPADTERNYARFASSWCAPLGGIDAVWERLSKRLDEQQQRATEAGQALGHGGGGGTISHFAPGETGKDEAAAYQEAMESLVGAEGGGGEGAGGGLIGYDTRGLEGLSRRDRVVAQMLGMTNRGNGASLLKDYAEGRMLEEGRSSSVQAQAKEEEGKESAGLEEGKLTVKLGRTTGSNIAVSPFSDLVLDDSLTLA